MQQTEKRGFNIIETSDAFSPEALNENTQKIEAALEAHEAAVEEVTDALDARIAVLEAKKMVFGTFYVASETPNVVELGFTPVMVFAHEVTSLGNSASAMAIPGVGAQWGMNIIENGFQLYGGGGYNSHSGTYIYVAFA